MVSTFQIKPAPLLQPYISCYALRIFNSEEGLPKPHHAQPEYYLSFFLKKDKFCDLIDNDGKFQSKRSNTLVTILTESIGTVSFKGSFVLFSVLFKANGLFAIFGVPQKLLINELLPAEDFLGNDHRLLEEQLESSQDINEMGMHMNAYLIRKFLMQRHKTHTTAIASASHHILRNKGLVSIDALVFSANMSLRNFERRFIDEVGVTVKHYMRITRFSNAIMNKTIYPDKSWTTISHEGGYFDQAHFIKECKEFSSKTPYELFRETPPPTENFIEEPEP